jgi:hypothetical protein
MAEEKKLGPGITYTNPDKTSKIVTVAGVLLKEGQSVNLVEKLGEKQAQPILNKLAKNRYFQVDGGPKHEEQEQTVTSGGGGPTAADNAVIEAQRIRASQGDEAADKYIDSLDEDGNVKGGGEQQSERRPKQGEPPPDVQTPDKATLERPAPRRT